MTAILDLEQKLFDLRASRKEKIDTMSFHEKQISRIQTEIHEVTNNIKEYEFAIAFLKRGKQSESCNTTIVGDESCEILD